MLLHFKLFKFENIVSLRSNHTSAKDKLSYLKLFLYQEERHSCFFGLYISLRPTEHIKALWRNRILGYRAGKLKSKEEISKRDKVVSNNEWQRVFYKVVHDNIFHSTCSSVMWPGYSLIKRWSPFFYLFESGLALYLLWPLEYGGSDGMSVAAITLNRSSSFCFPSLELWSTI